MRLLYDELEAMLSEAQADLGASEVHGLQCGLLCMNDAIQPQHLLELQLKELACAPSHKLKSLLETIYMSTSASLDALDFAFEPVLPSDDDEFAIRVACLADWCRGFLYGLSLGGVSPACLQQEPLAELTQDLVKLAQISSSPDEVGSDEDEANYIELVEYIRVAVQTIHNELKCPHQLESKMIH